MSARVTDPEAAAQEDLANRRAAQAGARIRFCFHPDRTVEFIPGGGTRTTCDYCPALADGLRDVRVRLAPWAYPAEGYTAPAPGPVTVG